MKNKKIVAIVALALMTNYVAPISIATKPRVNKILLSKPAKSIFNQLNSTNIDFYNIWGGISAELSFNTKTMKMEVTRKSGDLGSGNNNYMEISLYNSKTNNLEINQQIKDGSSTNLSDLLNNKSFNYGDIIGIRFEEGTQKPNISNIGLIPSNGEMNYYKITENGLVKYNPNVTINPLQILNGNKITTTTTITGTAMPNKKVSVMVNGEVFIGITNSKGDFNINITDNQGFTNSTCITVKVPSKIGYIEEFIKPTLQKGININKSGITINNVWSQLIGTIKFNPINQKTEVSDGAAPINPYLHGEAFGIYVYNPSGKLLRSSEFYGNEFAEDKLNELFNNINYQYGDIIKIKFIQSSNITISNLENQKKYNVRGDMQFKIEKEGLVNVNLPTVKVDPLEILGRDNNLVKNATIKGKTLKSNSKVTVNIGAEKFVGISNNEGDFSINIQDENGFTENTKIEINTNGELSNIISPIAEDIPINKAFIKSSNNQILKFNLDNMTIENNGKDGFSVQLIDGKNGQDIASYATTDFNAFQSKNNINGVKFKYGDIIAIYENKEEAVTDGDLILNQGNDGKGVSLNTTNKFTCFEITQKGLIPITNPNLVSSQALYNGTNTINITGKANANTNLTISYGGKSQEIKTSSNGNFKLNIPFSDLQIGEAIRIFENNRNEKILTVQYDNKIIHLNKNVIKILNNDKMPVFNIGFNPGSNEINVQKILINETYSGVFYGNYLNIKIINPKTGEIIYDFKGDKVDDINSFVEQMQGKKYSDGDIIQISYNPNYTDVEVLNSLNKNIGTTDGKAEYFEITNSGLVNITKNFVNINPLNIINGSKIVNTVIIGKVNPNENVVVNVNGKKFTGISNSKGKFSLNISDVKGFKNTTNIIVTAKDYIPTVINPNISSELKLVNSAINFYATSNKMSTIQSSITFNPISSDFLVNNYSKSFGDGQKNYFNLSLYNSKGKSLWEKSFNNGSTNELSSFLNKKSFSYGDIIALKYDDNISKIAVLNGNQSIGNITGKEEYFEITEKGLVPVILPRNIKLADIMLNNNNLIIKSILNNDKGKTENSNQKIVISNSHDNILCSFNTSILKSNSSEITGVISEKILNDIMNIGKTYNICIDDNNKLIPIYGDGADYSNSMFSFNENAEGQLTITLTSINKVDIKNANDINNYENQINTNINKIINVNSNLNDFIKNNNNLDNVITSKFINLVGISNLENFFNKNQENKNFFNWVLNNPIAMQEYINGVGSNNVNMNGLEIWSEIWSKYPGSRSGFNLKLAIATGISNAVPILSWPSIHYYDYGDIATVGNAVQRYEIFENLNSTGQMFSIFSKLSMKNLEFVVDTRISNNQIEEMRNIILQNHNGFINVNDIANIDYTINYNSINPFTKQSVYSNGDFYGPNPNIADVWRDGGVCYSISNLGTAACQIFGLPALPVTQENGIHKVFLYYTNNNTWLIGNNVFGWANNMQGDISGWSNGIADSANTTPYTLLYTAANTPQLKVSNQYLWLAQGDVSINNKMKAIDEAIKIQPLNLPAWLMKINLMKANPNMYNGDDYLNVADEIMKDFKEYPMPMFDLMLQIQNEVLQKTTSNQYSDFVNMIKNNLSSVADSKIGPENAIAQEELKKISDFSSNQEPMLGKLTIKSWGSDTDVITFKNGLISSVGTNKWIASGENSGINIKLYSNKLNVIKNINAPGYYEGSILPGENLSGLLNNTPYKIGDIIQISYNPGSRSKGKLYLTNKNLNTNVISNHIIFEITANGLMELNNEYKTPNGKSYNISNGQFIPNISGLENISLNIGTLFNPMKGITIPKGDKLAIISNNVNIDESGIYNVVYKVTYSNGQTMDITRIVTVKSNNIPIKLNNEAKDIYWSIVNGQNCLIINGQISNDNDLNNDVNKKLIIENNKGEIIKSMDTVSLNWYSLNKSNYSGYQAIIPINTLSILKKGEDYKFAIKYNNKIEYLQSNMILPINSQYLLSNNNSNNVVTVSKRTVEKNGIASYKSGYSWDGGFIINANININNKLIPKNLEKKIVISNNKGDIVYTGNTIPVNWYSNEKNDYSGLQAFIPKSILLKLNNGNYTVNIDMIYGNSRYEIPIKGNDVEINNNACEVYSNNDLINIKKNIIINKKANVILKDKYQDGKDTVLNFEINIVNVPYNSEVFLNTIDKNGKEFKIHGTLVNWYSNTENNYNGVQFILNNKTLKNYKNNKILLIVGNIIYHINI